MLASPFENALRSTGTGAAHFLLTLSLSANTWPATCTPSCLSQSLPRPAVPWIFVRARGRQVTGHQRRKRGVRAMSAYTPTPEIALPAANGRDGPPPDIGPAWATCSAVTLARVATCAASHVYGG